MRLRRAMHNAAEPAGELAALQPAVRVPVRVSKKLAFIVKSKLPVGSHPHCYSEALNAMDSAYTSSTH